MNPVQKRTGSESASSHESQDVTPPCRVAAQLDKSTLLPAPADPTTTVRRWLAPASSCPSSVGLVSSVVGSVVGRNFAIANRASCGTRSVTVAALRHPRGLRSSFTPQASNSLPPGSGAALEISSSQHSPRLSKLRSRPPGHPARVVRNPEAGRRLLIPEQKNPDGGGHHDVDGNEQARRRNAWRI